jgi:hypothetical protein
MINSLDGEFLWRFHFDDATSQSNCISRQCLRAPQREHLYAASNISSSGHQNALGWKVHRGRLDCCGKRRTATGTELTQIT